MGKTDDSTTPSRTQPPTPARSTRKRRSGRRLPGKCGPWFGDIQGKHRTRPPVAGWAVAALELEATGLFRSPDQVTWGLSLKHLMYASELLEYHLETTFDRNKQSQDKMAKQLVAATVAAVTTSAGPGSLKDVLRPWDVTAADITWDDKLLSRWSNKQLAYCFRVVHFYYSVTVSADDTTHSVFQYPGYKYEHGLALFRRDPYSFGLCLRDVYINFSRSVENKFCAHQFARVVAGRLERVGGGLAGSGSSSSGFWTAGSYWVFTSQMRKHLPDDRLYTPPSKWWLDQWTSEGRKIVDEEKLWIPQEEFLTISKAIQDKLATILCRPQDLVMVTNHRADFCVWAQKKVGPPFLKAVNTFAPSGLRRRKGILVKSASGKTLGIDILNSLKEIASSLFNTRAKMVCKNEISIHKKTTLKGLSSFRNKVAACTLHAQKKL